MIRGSRAGAIFVAGWLVAFTAAGCGEKACDETRCAGQCIEDRCVSVDGGGGGCTLDTDCPSERPICEAASCRPCLDDGECGAGFTCGDGACEAAAVACVSDSDCEEIAGRPHCDTFRARCAACTSDSHCPGLGQVCDRQAGACVTPTSCTSDAECADPARPRCEPALGSCVACLADADCDLAARQTCERATHTCLDFSPCTSDGDCVASATGSRCELASGACVGCTEDLHCLAGTGRTCDPAAQSCVGGIACESDAGCEGLDQPRCDPRLGLCVDCLASADCDALGSTCDTQTRACRDPIPCSPSAPCTAPQVCDPGAGFCVECLVQADCALRGAVCVGGICDASPPADGRPGSPCTTMTECAPASTKPADAYDYWCLRPHDAILGWQWYQGYCMGFCDSPAECPPGSVCLGGGCWDACEGDADCRPGYGCEALQAGGVVEKLCAPRCDPALASRISCTADRDCGTGLCDTAAGNCACSPVGGPCQGLGYCLPGGACVPETDANGEETGWAGGACIVFDCDPPAVPCPAGSSCYVLGPDTTACLPDCDPNDLASCGRPEYGCLEVDRYVLGGACRLDADCPARAPNCLGAGPTTDGTCARTCASDADCDASQGHLCTNIGREVFLCADPFQLGACYPGCATDADCGACTADADCRPGQSCRAGMCRIACTSASQCAAGQVCAGGACAQSCVDATDCPRGEACAGGACTAQVLACDPLARRCDLPCQDDLDCDRSRTCELSTARCETACASATDDCGPVGRCEPQAQRCEVDCRVLPASCPESTYCDEDGGDCLERCGAFGAGTCADPEICDPLTGACVDHCGLGLGAACGGSTACGADALCWDGTCQPRCTQDDQCDPGSACLYGIFCHPCPAERRRCEVGSGACFACFQDATCGAAAYCDVGGTYSCVARCGGVGGGSATCAAGQICDVDAGGRCVTPCTDAAECLDPARPFCHGESGLCGACGQDADCAVGRCDPLSRACVACLEDGDCTDPAAPACGAGGACVECTSPAHCAGHASGEACDPKGELCVACVGDSDCPSLTPLCNPETFLCLPCTEDAECAAGERCHLALNGGECRPPCGPLAGSPSGQPLALANGTFVDAAGSLATFGYFRGSNDVWAFTPAGAGEASADLLAFGFTVPADAVILGIEVQVEAAMHADPAPEADQWILSAELISPAGTASASRSDLSPLTAVDTVRILGGPTDLWDLAWAPAEVSDARFGVRVRLTEAGALPDVVARIDQVLVTVHYAQQGATDCSLLSPDLTCSDNLCQ